MAGSKKTDKEIMKSDKKELKGEVSPPPARKLLGKFPSIPHLDFSPQVHSDDIQLDANLSKMFLGVPVVVTEKLDGGNCCLRDGNVYARTHKKPTSHESFSWIKQMYAGKKASMDPKLSFFGENLYAAHSIRYNRLESYFYLFAVREEDGNWKSWKDVEQIAEELELPTTPVVFKGEFKEMSEIKKLMDSKAKERSHVDEAHTPEGFVIRLARGYSDEEFAEGTSIAKYVRKGHCQTDEKWGRTWTQNPPLVSNI
mmetsp:Transcript_29560/g.41067  ORF Transcript_29560/g.41067 Transcript_29560/m.41067 type:complete len:255 (-) Transcript_29560:146-910(-)